jgi:hypothetical protein
MQYQADAFVTIPPHPVLCATFLTDPQLNTDLSSITTSGTEHWSPDTVSPAHLPRKSHPAQLYLPLYALFGLPSSLALSAMIRPVRFLPRSPLSRLAVRSII